jgi:uncharacterized peroxidase-related enzyme
MTLAARGTLPGVTFVERVDPESATPEAAELLAESLAASGYVPNYASALAHRPGIVRGWQQLLGSIKETMEPRRYELVTLAVARRLRSSYCMLAHSRVILDQELLPPETLRDVAIDHRRAAIDETDAAAMDFAEKLADDATSVTSADVERLRALGLSDEDIVSVAAAAAARCFFTKLVDGLGIQPDAALGGFDPELREALVVGRPIAET